MINIVTPHTQLETDLEAIDAPLKRIESRTKANISDLNMSLLVFYGLPEDRLLAVANYHGPEMVTAIFEAHARNLTALNAILNDRGLPPIAAPIPPRELVVTDGVFSLVPLPEPVAGEDPVL